MMKVKEVAEVSEKPALKSHSAQGVLSSQALVTPGLWVCPQVFPPPLLHKLFSKVLSSPAPPAPFLCLITCRDQFHESGLSHLH